jgi:hypothetical protein
MTSAPDPSPSAGLDLPRDPAEYAVRRRGPGAAVWGFVAFGVLCVLAGAAVDRFTSQWLAAKPVAPSASSGAAASVPAADAQTPGALRDGPAPAPVAGPSKVETAALGSRLDRLAADQRRTAQAAGEALAAVDLSDAARASSPFADQLTALDRLLPDTADRRALQILARSGAPSRSALAAEFAGLADRAAVASRRAPQGASLLSRAAHMLEAVFTVRRVDRLTGDDPDAVLARAQRRADDGDLEGALKDLDALPPSGRDAVAGWRARAGRRVEIDRLVAAIRADAARDLAEAADQRASP